MSLGMLNSVRRRSILSESEKDYLAKTVLAELANGTFIKAAILKVASSIDKPYEKCKNVWQHQSLNFKNELRDLKTKNALERRKKAVVKSTPSRLWSIDEDDIILQTANEVPAGKRISRKTWEELSSLLGRTRSDCQRRLTTIKNSLNQTTQKETSSKETSSKETSSKETSSKEPLSTPKNIMSKRISELTKHFDSIEVSFNSLTDENKQLNENIKTNEKTIKELKKQLEAAESKVTVDPILAAQNQVLQEQLNKANRELNITTQELNVTKEDLAVLIKANEISRRISKLDNNSTPITIKKDKDGNIEVTE